MTPQVKKNVAVSAAILAAIVISGLGWSAMKPSGPGPGFVSGNGRIEATEIDIATKLGGRVQEIMVNEGDFVQAGQPLAQMQIDVLDAQRDEARAQSQQAITAVASAEAQVAARKSDTAAARAVVAQRESELDATQRRFARSEPLAKRGVTAVQELDDDRAHMRGAEAALAAAQAQVAATEAAIKAAQAQVVGANSGVAACVATIARVEADIKDSELKSPRNGRVQYRVAQPGEVLAAGGKVLNLVDLSDVYMTFFLPETAVGKVAMGSEVRIVLDAAPQVQIGAWVDGSMPQRAETVQGYVQGMHQGWLLDMAQRRLGQNTVGVASVETRFRYNPSVMSLPAMVPTVIPLLLLMIPAMLTALSVVREKEMGSIINLYVTPVTRSEFLLGKQLPYVVLALLNFALLTLLAVTLFAVPLKGSFLTLAAGALLFVIFSTGFGLFASTFTRSQIAALFVTMIGTMIPAIQFAGMLNPVSSLEGMGAVIGRIYPASHFLTISRGVFSKALGFSDLYASFWPLLLAGPVIVGLSIVLLKKQET